MNYKKKCMHAWGEDTPISGQAGAKIGRAKAQTECHQI